jgi:phosphoglycolate phosphatase
MGYKVLLFDFDGTLCDSQDRSLRIINVLADEFKFKKISLEELQDFKNRPLKEVFAQLQIPLVRIPRIVFRAKNKFREEIDTLKPVEGISPIIRSLKQAGFRLGIVTSNAQSNVERFLEKHDLPGFEIIRGDSSLFGKAKVLKRLMKDLRLSHHETVYIGDETRDIEAAKSAKMKVVSVTWGYNSRELLIKNNPDYIVESPTELAQLFQLNHSV